jgi:hypothetical protein
MVTTDHSMMAIAITEFAPHFFTASTQGTSKIT